MKDWICLFEKYKIDRRLLDSYRSELKTLPSESSRRLTLDHTIEQLEKRLRFVEGLLDNYDNSPDTPREAVRRSEERLFLTYHYIRGMTMESTAEEMQISRDTVYRIRRRIVSRGNAPELSDEFEQETLFSHPNATSSLHHSTALR